MVLRNAHLFNYQMIPKEGNDIIVYAPSMGPIKNESSVKKLKFLKGKS